MAHRRKVTEPHDHASPGSQPDITPPEVRKTTLYLPSVLHGAAKQAARDAGLSLTAYVIEAIEHHIAGAKPSPTGPSPARSEPPATGVGYQPEIGDLQAVVEILAKRLERVELALGIQHPDRPTIAVRPQRHLTVTEVRDLVRAVLIEHGSPMPHRMLLDHLLYDRTVQLPGKDVSENLRTILVHPKSRGFVFIKRQGYWLDDRTVPERESTESPAF